MDEITTTIVTGKFLTNFNPTHIIDGLSTFRKKWAILILMEFKTNKIQTFQNLREKFSLSPSVLSSTLKELTLERLIFRKVYGQIPPLKVEYKITSHGKKMINALCDLIELIYENKKLH